VRKPNPLFPDPGYVPHPKRSKKRKKVQTKKQRIAGAALDDYKQRARRMRGLFGDQFKAKDGYDLRKINSWTPAQKAKVTKYFRVMAPHITGDFVVKRYRRQDSIDAAINASLQEQDVKLKGQTAVAFSIDSGDKLTVKIKRSTKIVEKARVNKKTGEMIFTDERVPVTTAHITKNGMGFSKLIFDKQAFLEDPDAEIDRVLADSNANVFRVLVGGQQQNKALTRNMVKDEIFNLIRDYSPRNIERKQDQRPFDEWLNGLVAYDGTQKRTLSGVERYIRKHERVVAKREIARLNKLSIDHGGKGYKTTIDKQINLRRRRKGKPILPADVWEKPGRKKKITKRARLKGRD